MSLLRPADVHRHLEPHERARTWRDDAACIGTPPATFEIPHGMSWASPEGRILAARAKAICAPCPVQAPCLAEALTQPDGRDYPIRGGTTPGERTGIRRNAKKPECKRGHDTSEARHRYPNGRCRECERERQARKSLQDKETRS